MSRLKHHCTRLNFTCLVLSLMASHITKTWIIHSFKLSKVPTPWHSRCSDIKHLPCRVVLLDIDHSLEMTRLMMIMRLTVMMMVVISIRRVQHLPSSLRTPLQCNRRNHKPRHCSQLSTYPWHADCTAIFQLSTLSKLLIFIDKLSSRSNLDSRLGWFT